MITVHGPGTGTCVVTADGVPCALPKRQWKIARGSAAPHRCASPYTVPRAHVRLGDRGPSTPPSGPADLRPARVTAFAGTRTAPRPPPTATALPYREWWIPQRPARATSRSQREPAPGCGERPPRPRHAHGRADRDALQPRRKTLASSGARWGARPRWPRVLEKSRRRVCASARRVVGAAVGGVGG